jgi:uncharacterized protein DUF4242
MVYVVERDLPGIDRSDLLTGLSRLVPPREEAGHAAEVRYLGSTIVLRDEACFCQFEGPSSDAVAEVNRQAGVPFDRIVLAVTVDPKGEEAVSVSHSVPATVQIGRGRLLGLVAAVAVLAATVTWVLVAFAFDNSGATVRSGQVSTARLPSAADDARRVPSIMSLTPERLAEGALGTGYALPRKERGPTLASVLAAMSPQTRQYTQAIVRLSFAQLAAGAAGHP